MKIGAIKPTYGWRWSKVRLGRRGDLGILESQNGAGIGAAALCKLTQR